MAIRQTWKCCDTSTSAAIKEWGQDIGAAFVAAGWQQTADAGQINWSTFTGNGNTNNTYFGYEMYQSTDALSATLPIYVKVFYRNANYTANNNHGVVGFAVGQKTDGAGNFLGSWWICDSTSLNGYNSGTTTRYEMDYAWYGTGSNIAMSLWRDGYTNYYVGQFFAVERSLDVNGNPTDEYFTCWGVQGGSTSNWNATARTFLKMKDGFIAYSPDANWQWSFLLNDGSGGFGSYLGNTIVSPYYPLIGKIGYPSRLVFAAAGRDFASGTIAQVNLYGQVHPVLLFVNGVTTTPIPGDWGSGATQGTYGSSRVMRLGMRWDPLA